MAKLLTVYNTLLEVGIALNGSTWTYATLCEGIESLTFANNETKQQYYFMCGKGFPTDHVTALAPVISCSGKRMFGDPAQDYVAGLALQLADARKSSVRLTQYDENGNPEVITCDCVIANIVPTGGGTTEDTAFSFDICLNGTPVVVNIAPLPNLTVVSVAGATGKTAVYVNPALTGSDTYMYQIAAAVAMPALGAAPGAGWATWNGTDELTAATGQIVGIVEIDTGGLAVKGGTATVTAG